MVQPVVVVEGANEVARALKAVGDKGLQRMLQQANKRSAEIVVRRAEPKVPVRTGRLKASLRATGTQRIGSARAGNRAVPYAAAIHWGRKRGGVIKARPFLYDAAKESRDEVIGVYTEEVGKLLGAMRAGVNRGAR